jgi:hypothetical protein
MLIIYMICKKGDFGGVKDRGVSLKNRKILFYLVCVPLRLGIAYTAYLIHKKKWFLHLVAIICILSLYFVKFDKDECVWWSRKMHYIILCIILFVSIIQIILKNNKPIVPALILIDLLLGISSQFVLKWY